MEYTSKELSSYKAVMEHERKIKTAYAPYGISFVSDIYITENGYIISGIFKEVFKTQTN